MITKAAMLKNNEKTKQIERVNILFDNRYLRQIIS